MKAVILAGGMGTRLSEETILKPKPMVEIGGKPILWHIMNIYSSHGIREFIIALGYKGEQIKEYFMNFFALNNDLSLDLSTGKMTIHDGKRLDWNVHLVDTGLHTQTGGRLKRLATWLPDGEPFCFTYGDGVADVDIQATIKFHESHGKLATITAAQIPARFGRMSFDGSRVLRFSEKPQHEEGFINGGFFVLNKNALNYIAGDETAWEREPSEKLVSEGQVMAYHHQGFWSCMDTLREKQYLEDLWATGKAPWKIWK